MSASRIICPQWHDEYREPGSPCRECEKDARIARLEEAARAVIERWETPTWKDVGPTADVINRLRAALAKQEPPK